MRTSRWTVGHPSHYRITDLVSLLSTLRTLVSKRTRAENRRGDHLCPSAVVLARVLQSRGLMHQISFMLKRCFHSALRFHREFSQPFHRKLTPARFDLLHTIVVSRGAEQTDIVKMLGVTRPTISRMLRSLRELGWIQRKRSPRHPRAWIIFLTDIGKSLMKLATRVIIKRGFMHNVYRDFNDRSDPDPDWRVFLAVHWLDKLARHLGDGATFEFDYGHPDD